MNVTNYILNMATETKQWLNSHMEWLEVPKALYLDATIESFEGNIIAGRSEIMPRAWKKLKNVQRSSAANQKSIFLNALKVNGKCLKLTQSAMY